MDIAVELSLYPLDADYIPPIQDFIDRLNTHGGLKVVTNSMFLVGVPISLLLRRFAR